MNRQQTLCLLLLLGNLNCSCGQEKQSAKPQVNPSPRLVLQESPLSRETRQNTSFALVAKKVGPSVVNVYSSKLAKRRSESNPSLSDPLFRRFFGRGDPGSSRPRQEQSLGSGVIVSEDGYILTNSHVVEEADETRVALADGTEYNAILVGIDPATDIAVLKIQSNHSLPAATLTDSDKVEVGDMLLAVGNPFGVGQTLTLGVCSATGRSGFGIVDYEDFIQTDASINPGNSGGALADADGRVVAINTAILSRTGGNQGIGFAVPINLARFILERIVTQGRVVRGFMGVMTQPLTPELVQAFHLPGPSGALVGGLSPGSPADKAGLREGDIILELNKKKVTDSRHLRMMAAQTLPGTKIIVTVLRGESEKSFDLIMGELPSEEVAQSNPLPRRDPKRPNGWREGMDLGEITPKIRQQIELPAKVQGPVVLTVDPASAGFAAGLRPGDIILEVNRRLVKNEQDLATAVTQGEAGAVLLRVWSHGATRYVVVNQNRQR